LSTFILEMQKSLYPKEVLIYSIKYSPQVVSFQIDESKPDIFIFSIVSRSENFEDFQNHVMERVQFSYLRYEISQKTRTERELIIGRALYRSCTQIKDE